jgi:Pyridoxamine 5'-phosphate oxidase
MSVKVELDRLLEVVEGFGTVPMLLTTDDDGRPRASAVSLAWDGDDLRVRAGHRSVTNAAVRPLVSLLWPAPPGERYALLVDGVVVGTEPDPVPEDAPPEGGRRNRRGGSVVIRPGPGILHVVTRPH